MSYSCPLGMQILSSTGIEEKNLLASASKKCRRKYSNIGEIRGKVVIISQFTTAIFLQVRALPHSVESPGYLQNHTALFFFLF